MLWRFARFSISIAAMDQSEKRQRGRPRAFKPSPDAASVQSLDRALRILAIVAAGDGLSLTEIAEQCGLAPPRPPIAC